MNFKINAKQSAFIGLLLVALIISIPVTTAQIISAAVRGNDGYDNYLETTDTMSVTALVQAPPGVTSQQIQESLRFGSNPGTSFNSCSGATGGQVSCTLSQAFEWRGRSVFPYSVNLVNREGVVLSTLNSFFYVDSIGPRIEVLNKQQRGQYLNVTVRIRDEAFPNSASNCVGTNEVSGVVRVGNYLGSSVSYPVVAQPGSCSNIIAMLVPIPQGATGLSFLNVTAVDRFGNTASLMESATVDAQPPTIGTVFIGSARSPDIFFVGQGTQNLRIRFNASDDAGLARQYALINGQNYGIACVPSTVTPGFRSYVCSSNEIMVSGSQLLSGSIVLEDIGGNSMSVPLERQIGLDTTPPALRIQGGIRGGVSRNGTIYVGPSSPLLVDLDETESGMSAANVQITTSTGTYAASTCYRQSSVWTCEVPVTGAPTSSVINAASISGADDAGNSFSSSATYAFVYDGVGPIITTAMIYGEINGLRIPNIVTLGEELKGMINVSDRFEIVSGVADVSALNFSVRNVTITCDRGSCVFAARAGQTARQGSVRAILFDDVGNNATVEWPRVTVVGVGTGGEIPAFTTEVQVRPEVLDRSIARLVNQRAIVDVVFNAINTDAAPVAIGFRECISAGAPRNDQGSQNRTLGRVNDIAFVQSIRELPVSDPSQLSRRLEFTFRPTDFTVDTLNFTCSYNSAFYRGGSLVRDERVNFSVSFALGGTVNGLPENYQKKLDDAISDANDGILNKIAKFDEFVQIARNICNLWNTIKGFLAAVGGLLEILGVTKESVQGIPVVGPPIAQGIAASGASICESKNAAQSVSDDLVGGIANKFCNFVTCQFSVTGWALGMTDFGKGLGYDGQEFSDFGTQNNNVITPLKDVWTDDSATSTPPAGTTPGNSSWSANKEFATIWNLGVSTTAASTEDSLILSTLNLCLPGITKNLNEYRQIQCRYALCLRDDVPNGVPIDACEAEKSYAQCKYVYGELFNLINIIFPFDYLMKQIKAILSDPAAMIGALWGGYCMALCKFWYTPGVGGTAETLCSLKKHIEDVGTIIGVIAQFAQGDILKLQGTEDACDALDEEE